ncbi:MAG: hypothetical protein HS104_39360 [Polyangiaceae bacterium]|nr:hypothetical protein [Polyangiaceae bacterium]MCL4756271.1 hypothetical protein [Myxococcales bacterium]
MRRRVSTAAAMALAVTTGTCVNPTDICTPQEADLGFFSKGDCVMTRSSFFQGHEWLTSFANDALPPDDRFTREEVHAIAEGNRRVDWPKELLVHLNAGVYSYVRALTEYTDRNEVQRMHFLLTDTNQSAEAARDANETVRALTRAAARDWIPARARALSELGKASHVIQDSFSDAHTFRDRDHASRPWCIQRVKAFRPRKAGYERYTDGAEVLFHGGSTDAHGNSLSEDSIGHTTTKDSIYRPGRDCNDPTTPGAVEACLNDFAKRARDATRDYLSLARRVVRTPASGADLDAVVDQEIDAFITEHLSLCPDAPQ